MAFHPINPMNGSLYTDPASLAYEPDEANLSAGILAMQDEICQLVSKHRLQNPRALGYILVVDQIGGVTCLDDLIAARRKFTTMLPEPHQLYVADDYPFDTTHLVALPLDGGLQG